jgi:DNA-directed RNA polymerase specialized sigma24 family protein
MDDSAAFKTEIDELLQSWVQWLRTRKFYAPPLPQNILEILKGSNSGKEPPNADNDALCAAFNLVIEGAPDGERLPFLYVYLKQYRPNPIKTLAHDLGIDADTVYQRAHKVAPEYLSKAKLLAEMSAKIHREVDGFID